MSFGFDLWTQVSKNRSKYLFFKYGSRWEPPCWRNSHPWSIHRILLKSRRKKWFWNVIGLNLDGKVGETNTAVSMFNVSPHCGNRSSNSKLAKFHVTFHNSNQSPQNLYNKYLFILLNIIFYHPPLCYTKLYRSKLIFVISVALKQ